MIAIEIFVRREQIELIQGGCMANGDVILSVRSCPRNQQEKECDGWFHVKETSNHTKGSYQMVLL